MQPSLADLTKAALPAVLAQGPLFAVIMSSENAKAYINHAPVRAVCFFLLYEVVVGVAIKVWKRLEEDTVKLLADGVRSLVGHGWAWLLGIFTPFRRRYLRQLVFDHRDFNVRGLLTIGTYNLRLDQAFVELQVAPGEVHRARMDPVSERSLRDSRTVWDFLRIAQQGEGQTAWAIIGPPGSGKTTLLQNVTLTLALGRQGRQRLRSYVPLLLFLRDHAKAITSETAPNLGALAEDAVGQRRNHGRPPKGWFEQQLLRGRCLVMLDGLDEVADEVMRRKVRDWVDEQIVRYPLSPVLLTARPNGYRSAPLARVNAVLEMQSFGPEQVESFVTSWYLANEVMGAGNKVDQGVQQQAAERAEDLLRRLRERPPLLELTRNPLLLTMIATVHRYRGALPGRRVELYKEICDVFLGHWRAARGVAVRLTAAQTRSVLQPLAAWLMEKRQRDVGAQEALSRLRDGLEQIGLRAEEVKSFLPEVQASTGLLIEREQGQWSFAHLTFQEYLCSAHWQDSGPPVGAAGWDEYVADPWWHETLRLYAAQEDASALLESCLRVASVPSLTLAHDLLEESLRIRPELRNHAEDRLIADLESADPTRRRLAAEVQLARRLRNFVAIDDKRELSRELVTGAEYMLFARGEGQDHLPFQWVEGSCPAGHARSPVSGLTPEAAQKFCNWLSRRDLEGRRYRLPTAVEAQQVLADGQGKIGAWCWQSRTRLIGLDEKEAEQFQAAVAALGRLPVIQVKELLGCEEALPNFDREGKLRALRQSLTTERSGSLDLELLTVYFGLELAVALLRADDPARCRELAGQFTTSTLERARNERNLAEPIRDVFLRPFETEWAPTSLTRERSRDFALDRELAVAQEQQQALAAARHRTAELVASTDSTTSRLGTLIGDLVDAICTDTRAQRVAAGWRFTLHYTEFAWDVLKHYPAPRSRGWWSWGRRGVKPVEPVKKYLITLYWLALILSARAQGLLPAWEGLRVVRERK